MHARPNSKPHQRADCSDDSTHCSLFHEASELGDTFRRLLQALRAAAVPHVFVGAAALRAYGLTLVRAPAPGILEVVLGSQDLDRFRAEVLQGEFRLLPGQRTRLYDPLTQVEVDLIDAETPVSDPLSAAAGLRIPNPRCALDIDQSPVPPLEQMMEWLLGRNTAADRRLVIELARLQRLDSRFAERLHPAVRAAFVHGLESRISRLEGEV